MGYKGLQGVTKGDRVYKKLQLVTRSYNRLKEDTRDYRGLEGITHNLFSK